MTLRNGTCPHCENNDIHYSSSGAYILTAKGIKRTEPLILICVNCGYTETYQTNKGMLKYISENWTSWSQRKKKKNEE
jgi:predicted nucleic-acid-binding Zn-ribbon protein